jgi:hypothetical protein
METVILSEGISHRYRKFIEPKLSEEQKKLIKQLSEEIKREILIPDKNNSK